MPASSASTPTAWRYARSTASMRARTCSSSTRMNASTAACASPSARWMRSSPTPSRASRNGSSSTESTPRSGRTSRPRRTRRPTPTNIGRRWASSRSTSPRGLVKAINELAQERPLSRMVALAPCVIGYAEIAARLAAQPDARAATNPYRVWIAEYAGAPYQEVAAKARAHLDALADLYATPAREAELISIFKEATRLETDFWEMGWRAGQ